MKSNLQEQLIIELLNIEMYKFLMKIVKNHSINNVKT